MPVKKFIKIIFMTMMSIVHLLVGLSTILFILLYSLGIDISIVTLSATMVALSFVIFRRCIQIDIYEYIKGFDNNLPDCCKDGWIFKKIQEFLFNKDPNNSGHFSTQRLDILSNLNPFLNTDNFDVIDGIHNERIHYIVINSVLAILLLVKYNLKEYIPLFLIWFFTIFPV